MYYRIYYRDKPRRKKMKKRYLALFSLIITIIMIYTMVFPVEVKAFEEDIPPTSEVYNQVSSRTIAYHGNSVPGYTTIVIRTEKPTRGYINVYGNGISTKINLSTVEYKTEHVVHWAPWNDSKKEPLPPGEYVLRLDVTDADYNRMTGLSLGKITVIEESNPKPLLEILEINPSEVVAKPGEEPIVTVTYRLNRHADILTVINQWPAKNLLGKKEPGVHQMTWDLKDENGKVVPPGYHNINFQARELNYNTPDFIYKQAGEAKVYVKDYNLSPERMNQILPEIKFDAATFDVKNTNGVTGSITVAEEATINVWVVNNLGKHVREVITNGNLLPGLHGFTWDGRDFMGGSSPNANYFLNVYVRDSKGIYGEIRKNPVAAIKIEGSYDISVPQPVKRVRVREDNTEITVGPYIQKHVLSKGMDLTIISKGMNGGYGVLVVDGVAGEISIDKVDLLDLDLIPLKWGQPNKDYVLAYRYLNHIVEETLSNSTTVRVLEEHDMWYRVLLASGKQAFVKKADLTLVDSPQQVIAHTVQSGDTLWKIATKYNVTVDAIIGANNLTSPNNIMIGQKLTIPAPDETKPSENEPIIHVVASGDALWKIALKYNTTVDAILKANDISLSQYLTIGQKLTIPIISSTPEPLQSSNIYEVQSGDTLWKISQSQNVPIDTIIKMNNLDPTKYLGIGQKLYLPEQTQKIITYTVKAGDTLWKISQAHGTAIQSIVEANGLNINNSIIVGQQIIIPIN